MFWTALSFLQAKPAWVAVRGWGKHECLSPSRVVQLLSAMWHPRGSCSACAEIHPRDHSHSSHAISSKITKCMMNQMNNKYRAQNDVVEFLIFTTADKML